jgi:hypothetical protein
MQSVGDLMTFVEELFEERSPVGAPANNTGVTWEFAFTVTEEMKQAARQRNQRKCKLPRGRATMVEAIFPSKLLRGKW